MSLARVKLRLVSVRSGSNVFHIASGTAGQTMCGISPKGGLLPPAESGRSCAKCRRVWRDSNGVANSLGITDEVEPKMRAEPKRLSEQIAEATQGGTRKASS